MALDWWHVSLILVDKYTCLEDFVREKMDRLRVEWSGAMEELQRLPKGPCGYMGGCQNYGPFLGPYYNTAPNI